jgi:purine-binding chemotaxis protein CheW
MRDSGSRQAKPQATSLNRGQAWQEALARAQPGAYTSEQLQELARNAGFREPQQFASQAQALGIGAASVVPQHLLFALGTVTCALPASAVQGVERIPEVTPVPNTAAWVLGVVQVWGAIVSVVDIAAFVGLAPLPRSSHNRLLVVNSPAMSVGLLVEAMVEMRALGENLASRLDSRGVPEELRPYAAGALTDAGGTVVVLDPARLLASEKLQHYQLV